MSQAIGAYIGVSKQTEMLLMTVLALWVNIFDMAIFEISSNLDQVWNVEIDKEIFNPNAEYIIRMLLSGVVLIRTFTLHLYIAFLIAVFWPVCFGTRPTLMLPWLVVSAIKNLGTGLVSIGTGGYTCLIYGALRPACLRFLLSQIIDLSPSFYMWFVGLSLYCDLKKPKSVNRLQVKAMEDQELNVALRRRKVKSMIDEDILRQQFESRSFQKKFLGTSAVEVNEFIKRCSYDNLKNKFSRSLDSLLDVLTVQTELLDIEDSEPIDIESSSTLQQKTAKLLGISMDEIDYIKQNRQTRTDFPVYPVQPQKKIQAISLINSRYESPAKLLPETSLYSPPNIKPIRVTKSELKSAKDFSKNESVHEKEMQVHDLTREQSFESLTKLQMQMVYQEAHSSFMPDDVVDDTVNVKNTNLSSKKTSGTKAHGGEYSNKNRDRYSRKQDRGKLEEDDEVEITPKYKFFNTMSDKSHYLLDEHCFLFDKESMLRNKGSSKVDSFYAKRKRSIDHNQIQNPSEEKQRRLNAPTIDVVSKTKTRFKDNAMNKKTPLDGKSENKSTKPGIRKMKEDVTNKKILKQSEKSQAIKKKIAITRKMPSNDFSNIPVLPRNIKSKQEFYNVDKSKVAAKIRKDNVHKNHKNNVSQETKLYTIEENKDIASVNSYEEKNDNLHLIKDIEENKSVTNKIEINASSILNQEEKNTLLKEEKKNEIISNEKEKVVSVLYQGKNKNILLRNKKKISADESKISVTAEIERINKNDLNISSKNDSLKTIENINDKSTVDKIENKCKSTEIHIPVPFISLKHSAVKMTALQKEAINQEEKLLPKEEIKVLFNTSQAISEKILQILKEKNKPKTDSKNAEDIFKEKNNKTELSTDNSKEFKFTAKIDEKEINLPVKSSSRNKHLEFHFKEKITKTKDNKMEDLFKKKTAVSERKDSKTSDKDKLGFPSYFSNKINRMITDACQIRKKSCKKINLFIKVPTNTNSKQRSKLSTIELFRKQSPPKTNLFDMTRKLSTAKLEIPHYKVDKTKDRATNLNKNKQVLNRVEINLFNKEQAKIKKEINLFNTEKAKSKKEINLFNTEEAKSKKEIYLFNTEKAETKILFCSHKSSSIPSLKSLSKTSVHSNEKLLDKTDEVQSISKENNNLSEGIGDDTSLISSFMSFRTNENSNIAELNTSSKTNKYVIKVDEPICVTKTKSSISTNADTKEAQLIFPLVKPNIVNDAKCVKKTESPYKINVSNQKSNTSTTAQKTITCRKLSEQAMNKIISSTKTDYSTKENELNFNTIASNQCFSTVVKKSNCKRLSEQAINKIISLTNTGYSNLSNRRSTDSKLDASIVQETSNCKKLSDFAIDKLLAITSPKFTSTISMTNKPRTKVENKEEILEGKNVLLNIKHSNVAIKENKSDNLNYTIGDRASYKEDSDDFNKTLKATQSENSNNLHLNESNTSKESKIKVKRKSSIPVIKEDITISQKSPKIIPLTKIDNNTEIEFCMEKKCSDPTSDLIRNKSHIIGLVEDAVYTKSISEMNSPIRENSKKDFAHNITLIASTNNVFLNNSNSNLIENISPLENQNILIIDTDANLCCKEASHLDSSIEVESLNKTHSISNEIVFGTKAERVNKNCEWMSQNCINIFTSNSTDTSTKEAKSTTKENQNIPYIKDKRIYEEILQNNTASVKSESIKEPYSPLKEDVSKKEENLSNSATNEENKCFASAKNECKVNCQCNETILTTELNQTYPNIIICKWIPQGCIELITLNNSEPVEEKTSISKKEENIFVTKNEEKLKTIPSKNASDTKISVTNEEKNNKEISQHRIKLIPSTDKNFVKNSDNIEEELVNEKNTNVMKIKHEHKEGLQNNSKLLSSLLYEAENDSIQPLKETKVCRGTSQHNIKLISSIKHESLSETNLCYNVNKRSQTRDDLYVPLKEQKVCRGSAQNYVKLISLSKEEFASKTNISHKEALSNILKEYQSNPIMKEEKVCKGTSKHKIKLISSYKKDSPNKINLFRAETEYKNNKNENITIIKEEKMCKGTLQHSIKLVSSSKNDPLNKTIFIVNEQLPYGKETIPLNKDNNAQKSANRPSRQTNVFVNVNTANGKQNFTVIQKRNDDKESAQSETQHGVNLFVKDRMTSTDESNQNKTEANNLDEENCKESLQKIISNTIQDFFESETEKEIEKTETDLVSTNKESDVHSLIDIKPSEILSSLINKVQTSLKLQESNKDDLYDENSRSPKYHSNQIDFGCQTSTLSKKVLENNPNEIAKKLSRTKSITKSINAKSYQDLNLQKIAFTMTTKKNSNSILETKSNNENLSKDEKRDSTIVLHSRSSRNASYVSIHKERLEKAKSLESDLNKSAILQKCAFFEDGYTRLYNLLGVKEENFDIKARKKYDSSFNF